MKFFFCLLFLFLGESLASQSSNQYVDAIIRRTLQDVIHKERLDPAKLPNYTFDYKNKTIRGTVKGKADYTSGTLSGLSKVKRHSDCQGPKNVTGGTMINCTLTFDVLQTSYNLRVKYDAYPTRLSIGGKGDIRNTIVDVEITEPDANQATRVFLNFRSYGTMETKFTNLGPLNTRMMNLECNYREQVRSEVVNTISNRFRHAFELAAASVPMPFR